MTNQKMLEQVKNGRGFIAALGPVGRVDAEGVEAVRRVGKRIFGTESQMFDLIHAMRARIIKSPAFTGDKVVGAILFEQTMDRLIDGVPTATYLWEKRGVVPFLKIDKGLEAEADGVQLMKPMPGLDDAAGPGGEGGHLRDQGTVGDQCGANRQGDCSRWWTQQFEMGAQVAAHGLMPILEPEVTISIADKAAGRGAAAGGDSEGAGQGAGRPAGDAEAVAALGRQLLSRRWSSIRRCLRWWPCRAAIQPRRGQCDPGAEPGIIASFSRALTEGLSGAAVGCRIRQAC
jgi:fructose-bisphosphate aldolase class I